MIQIIITILLAVCGVMVGWLSGVRDGKLTSTGWCLAVAIVILTLFNGVLTLKSERENARLTNLAFQQFEQDLKLRSRRSAADAKIAEFSSGVEYFTAGLPGPAQAAMETSSGISDRNSMLALFGQIHGFGKWVSSLWNQLEAELVGMGISRDSKFLEKARSDIATFAPAKKWTDKDPAQLWVDVWNDVMLVNHLRFELASLARQAVEEEFAKRARAIPRQQPAAGTR